MANIPTTEDAAGYILEIYVELNHARGGDVLRANNFVLPFSKPPWRGSDFRGGMAYAAQQGWVEVLPGGTSYRLTELGLMEASNMDLIGQCNEKLTIERQDGSRHEGVDAFVAGSTIMIPDTTIPIATGDAVLRPFPSGLVDRLIVVDPGFHAKFNNMPAHYQIKYDQAGRAPAGSPGYNVHVTGDHARVNIQSTDNSINAVVYQAEDMAKLADELIQLRAALAPRAHDAEHYAALGAVASAEIAAKEGKSSTIGQALSVVGSGGKWAFDVATEIGVHLAAAALKPYLGLPPG